MVDKRSNFYNRSMKSWLQYNDIETYSTHDGGKCVVAQRFITTLKSKVYNHFISISKNGYIDKLDDLVNEYNKTYHSTIKVKPANVTSSKYIGFGIENNEDHMQK